MNQRTKQLRSRLLRRYYKSAALGWFRPKGLHWAKIVTDDGYWRWTRADNGIMGRLLRNPPLHVYQTVMRFKTESPPRGWKSSGYLLGGPLLFDADFIEKREPFSLWKIVDASSMIQELIETVQDRGDFHATRVMFSGFRGVHVALDTTESEVSPITLHPNRRDRSLLSLKYLRKQVARSLGYWCPGWDWSVSADIWRVSRVPWSIHGKSALRAIVFNPPYTSKSIENQLANATPFSQERKLRVRITRFVPAFTFVDGNIYGPFTKGWATKLPIAVANHLIWQDWAKPRESGPRNSGNWFGKDWQMLFRHQGLGFNMDCHHEEGDGG